MARADGALGSTLLSKELIGRIARATDALNYKN